MAAILDMPNHRWGVLFYHRHMASHSGCCLTLYDNTQCFGHSCSHVYGYPLQPILWKRFLDDNFFIWTGSENSLLAFLQYLNSCDPNISFTFEKSQQSVHFLDTVVSVTNSELTTDLCSKPTDSHTYLLFSSAHPKKCKESILYIQYLQIRCIYRKLSD